MSDSDHKTYGQDDAFSQWLTNIYREDALTESDLFAYYESVRYIGFDRKVILKELFRKFPRTNDAVKLIILCALRGPIQASRQKLPNGMTPIELGIPASARGKELSCGRITAATADLAAFYLKKLNVGKSMNIDCPAWLQFPSAGSILLPQRYRQQHREFSELFSVQIGGEFNEVIYDQMMANAYLDEDLALF
jgi:hypothetical protein